MLSSFIEMRFDRPGLFWGMVWTLVASLIFVGFMSIPRTPLTEATGVVALQRKVTDLYYAGMWFYRAQTNESGTAVAERTTYGNVEGLDKSGFLVVTVAGENDFVRERVSVADVKLTDLRSAAEFVRSFSGKSAKFEYYEDNQVVIWIDESPLNVKLIEAGVAVPEPNPPTNIVDKAFATYYWRSFYGTEK